MNKLRGEVEIELGGENWTLRPTFEALSNIEGKLNKSIPEIVREQRQGSVRLNTVATIIWEGIVAANGGTPPSHKTRAMGRLRYEEVGEMIVHDGLTRVISQDALLLFLLYGLAGDQKMSEAEKKAAEEEEPPMKRTE